MTATNFRDLLAGCRHPSPPGPRLVDYADADGILALPVPWVDCPSGCSKGGTYGQRNRMLVKFPCPACSGTGKATVAQLLAWGSAVAESIDSHGLSGTPDYEAVVWYRNRILGVQP